LNPYDNSFQHIGEELKNNKEFFLKAAEMKCIYQLNHKFMSERDFVLKIVRLNGNFLWRNCLGICEEQ
jgi:hypothetical protein